MAQKYLWGDIRPVSLLYSMTKDVISKAESLPDSVTQESLQAHKNSIYEMKTLLENLAIRVDRQQNQILELTQWLYQNLNEQDMLKLLIQCGIDRTELVNCYEVDKAAALSAQRALEYEKENENGQDNS